MTISEKDIAIAEKDKTISVRDEKIDAQAAEIGRLQRLLYGQLRERFQYPNNQLSLPFGIDPEVAKAIEEALEEKRKK